MLNLGGASLKWVTIKTLLLYILELLDTDESENLILPTQVSIRCRKNAEI